MRGNNGNDTIYGGSGDDSIMGDSGRDVMGGGSGADKFTFDDGDTATYGLRDRIMDFSDTEGDTIDLHWIDARTNEAGDQGFVWIASAAFFEEGQLRYYSVGGDIIVEGNTDVDLSPEFQLQVKGGNWTPSYSDFML